VRTPNLDRIANEGVRFTRAHTTAPVCSSGRSAFHVGLYQTCKGTHDHRSHRDDEYELPGGAQTVAERLEAAGQPFFAQLNFAAPHRGPSFEAARKRAQRIDQQKIELPPYYPDDARIRDEVGTFYDAIQLLDDQVGTTLQALETDKLLDNTVIFFFGDNGRCLIRGKQWLYQAGTHVPLLVRSPGILKPGTVREDRVLSLDITAQTLLYAGLPLPAPFDGQALFGAKPQQTLFTARDRCDMAVDRIRAIQDTRYKYSLNLMPEKPYTQHNDYILKEYPTYSVLKEYHAASKLNVAQSLFMAPEKPREELHDLSRDPHEVENLAGSVRQQVTLARLRRQLALARRQYDRTTS
jgi:arylsulfatase A-like enzyme